MRQEADELAARGVDKGALQVRHLAATAARQVPETNDPSRDVDVLVGELYEYLETGNNARPRVSPFDSRDVRVMYLIEGSETVGRKKNIVRVDAWTTKERVLRHRVERLHQPDSSAARSPRVWRQRTIVPIRAISTLLVGTVIVTVVITLLVVGRIPLLYAPYFLVAGSGLALSSGGVMWSLARHMSPRQDTAANDSLAIEAPAQ